MAIVESRRKAKTGPPKQPLRVQLLNASGEVIEGLIPSGKFPKEDPTLAIAKELSKHEHFTPAPVPAS